MNEDELATLQLLHPQSPAGAHLALRYILRHLAANARLLNKVGIYLAEPNVLPHRKEFLQKIALERLKDSTVLYSHFVHIREQFPDILTVRSEDEHQSYGH